MYALWLLFPLLSLPAHTDTGDARACLDNKVREGYLDQWRNRTIDTRHLKPGETSFLMVHLTRGLEYRFVACGDTRVTDLDLVLYDTDGRLREKTDTKTREPELIFEPHRSGSYFLGFTVFEAAAEGPKPGVAVAITYR